jgi:hypothetical protein
MGSIKNLSIGAAVAAGIGVGAATLSGPPPEPEPPPALVATSHAAAVPLVPDVDIVASEEKQRRHAVERARRTSKRIRDLNAEAEAAKREHRVPSLDPNDGGAP